MLEVNGYKLPCCSVFLFFLFSKAKANNHQDFGMMVQQHLDNIHFIDPTKRKLKSQRVELVDH